MTWPTERPIFVAQVVHARLASAELVQMPSVRQCGEQLGGPGELGPEARGVGFLRHVCREADHHASARDVYASGFRVVVVDDERPGCEPIVHSHA